MDFLKQRYEGIDWSQLNVKLSEAEVAADKAEKEALVRSCFEVFSFPPSLPPSLPPSQVYTQPSFPPCSLLNPPQLKEGSTLVAAAEKIIEETKHKMHLAATKRTNKDSLVEDVWEKNPKIKEEVRRDGWREGGKGEKLRSDDQQYQLIYPLFLPFLPSLPPSLPPSPRCWLRSRTTSGSRISSKPLPPPRPPSVRALPPSLPPLSCPLCL